MTDTRTEKSDKDEALEDTTMSLNLAEFQKRCRELAEISESADEASPEEKPSLEQGVSG